MFLFRRLTAADAHFARQADAPTYRALVREMRAADAYAFLPYVSLQKKAGRMWSALKRYRAEQKAVRTPAQLYQSRYAAPCAAQLGSSRGSGGGSSAEAHPQDVKTYMRQLAAKPAGLGSPEWPAAHAGCIMQ